MIGSAAGLKGHRPISDLPTPPLSINSKSYSPSLQRPIGPSLMMLHSSASNWPKNVPVSPKQINYPLYALTLSPEDQDPALLKLITELMFVGDEAECRDIELVDLVNYISHSGSLFEEQASTVASGSDSGNMQHDTYEACYRPKGRTSKLAIIVRLRMLQDTLLNLRLQQAKITSTVLELQAVESKTRLDSAVTAWRNSLAQEPMFSGQSSVTPAFASLFRISLEPTRHTALPRVTIPKIESHMKLQTLPAL